MSNGEKRASFIKTMGFETNHSRERTIMNGQATAQCKIMRLSKLSVKQAKQMHDIVIQK